MADNSTQKEQDVLGLLANRPMERLSENEVVKRMAQFKEKSPDILKVIMESGESKQKQQVTMEKDTLISSNRLFHYTPEKEYLLNILKEGFKPRWSLEDVAFAQEDLTDKMIRSLAKIQNQAYKKSFVNKLAIPMVCFCDIPLKLTKVHRKVYGDYAIGLKKTWAEKTGISPVSYVPNESNIKYFWRSIIEILQNNTKRQDSDIHNQIEFFLIPLMFLTKLYIGPFEKNGNKLSNYKFYDEREWRYITIPYGNGIISLSQEEFNKKKEKKNLFAPVSPLRFDISDITDIIVPEKEIEEIKEKIKGISKFKEFNLNKINSWETIQK